MRPRDYHSHWTVLIRQPGARHWGPLHFRVPNQILDQGRQEAAATLYLGDRLRTYNVVAIGASPQAATAKDQGCIVPLMQSASAASTPLRKVGTVEPGGASMTITATFTAQDITQSVLSQGAGAPKQLVESALHWDTTTGAALYRVVYPTPLLLTGVELSIIVLVDV